MRFGEIYKFKYKTDAKRKYDSNPTVIVIKSIDNKIFGINLNLMPSLHRDQVVDIFNSEIMKNFTFDEELLKMATDRKTKLEDQQIAEILFFSNTNNRKSMMEIMDKRKIKSERRLLKMMQSSFRIYNKKNLRNKPKLIEKI